MIVSIANPAKAPVKDEPTRQEAAKPKLSVERRGGKLVVQVSSTKREHKAAFTPRPGSKTAKILRLLRRPEGASLTELMRAMKWQPHSVRGFLSGTVKRKMRLKLASLKRPDGQAAYRLPSQ